MTPDQRSAFYSANRRQLVELFQLDLKGTLRKLRESEGARRDELVGIVGYLQDCLKALEPQEIPEPQDKNNNDYV